MLAKHPSRKSTPAKLNAAEFAEFGNKQAETLVEMQREVYGLLEQANHEWLARVEKERAMASDFFTKLSAAKSLPDVAQVYQESMMRRTEMMAEDSRNLFANSQKFMTAAAHLLSNGLPRPYA